MLKYIVKRVAIFIPTLFAISLLAFAISINSPGDPVEILYSGSNGNGEGQSAQSESVLIAKQQLRHQLGLDLPVFYFTLTNTASPDTLYRIYDPQSKEALNRLVDTYGNWDEISVWFRSLQELKEAASHISSTDTSASSKAITDKRIDELRQEISSLFLCYEDVVITSKLNKVQQMAEGKSSSGFILEPLPNAKLLLNP